MTFICRVPSIAPFALLAGLALVPAGCGSGDGVKSYDVPRTSESGKRDAGPNPAAGEYRMLGAMYPSDNPVWFFKFSGPTDVVTKYEADFDKLLASVKFAGDVLDFTPPAGWQRGAGRPGGVVATIKSADGKQEVSLTHLPGMAAGVDGNLARWVGMIGLRAGPDDVKNFTKGIDAGGMKGVRVDLKGPQDPATKSGPMMMGKQR